MTVILVLKDKDLHTIFDDLGEYYEVEVVDDVNSVFERIAIGDILLTFVPYSIVRRNTYLTRGFLIYQHPSLVYSPSKEIDTPLSVIVLESFNKISLSYVIEQKLNSWKYEKSVHSIDFEDNLMDLVIEGKLLECVSHDFGNALTLILGFSNALLEKVDPEDEDKAYMENVLESIDDSYNLVRRLISFKNLQSLAAEKDIDLLKFLEIGRKIWIKFVEKKYELITIFQVPPQTFLDIDLRLIEYGIFHLLLKLKTFKTNSASIAVYPVDYQGGSQWKFDILALIDKEPLEDVLITAELFSSELKIFRRIDTSVVVEIIRNNENTQVFISFMVEELPESTDVASLTNYIPKHVIVIDSDQSVRETLTRYFTKLGFNANASSDANSALSIIAKHPHEIDAVIIDLNGDDINLFELQKKISKLNSQIRIIATSGSNRIHCIEIGLLPRNMEFIQKPIDFKNLQFLFYN